MIRAMFSVILPRDDMPHFFLMPASLHWPQPYLSAGCEYLAFGSEKLIVAAFNFDRMFLIDRCMFRGTTHGI